MKRFSQEFCLNNFARSSLLATAATLQPHGAASRSAIRFLQTFLQDYGSTTLRQQAKARGLEPDECYCIGTLKELPDFAIAINLTSGGVDKLVIYQGLGFPEVLIWQDARLTLYDLRATSYQEASSSQFLPDLDLQLLAQFIRPQDQPQAIKDFLSAIRLQPS